ncbi:MAG TPA: DEAD/DEAH box helicase [Anaerolineae bacterium]|nr:DEAD/DEAH box helicase [Anaerolineae bacterium]
MHVLHGAWLPGDFVKADGNFVLWAETSQSTAARARRTSSRSVQAHPFALAAKDLRRAWLDLTPEFDNTLKLDAEDSTVVVRLPSTPDGPQASPGLPRVDESAERGAPQLAAWKVAALAIPPVDAPALLAGLPLEDATTPGIKIGADLRFWQLAGKLALEVLAGQRYAPALVKEDQRFLAVWQPRLDNPNDRTRLDRLAKSMPPICRAVGRDAKAEPPDPHALLDNFFAIVVDAFARWQAHFGRYDSRSDFTVAGAWLEALLEDSPVVEEESAASLNAFYERYRAWAEPIPGATGGEAFRLCFRLDPPPADEAARGILAPKPTQHDWALRYLLQANDDPSLLVPASTVWRERGSALKFLNRKFDAPQERLLAGLGQAARIFMPIESSLRAARPEACELNVEQAYTFIRETSLLLQASGFGVLVPGLGGKLGVKLNLKPKDQRPAPKGGVAGLSFESIVQYDWQLALGDATLTQAEFEKLAALKAPLVQVRGQWVEVRPEEIEQAVKFWEKRKNAGELSLQEALRLALALDPTSPAAGLPVTTVAAGGWLDELMQQLADGSRMQHMPAPEAFNGTLRPYQNVGLSWLAFLRQWGLGACLADDMGLGKTIEVIALLLHEQQSNGPAHRPSLLICPTSVVGNWQRELARFAPALRTLVHHGAARAKSDLKQQTAQHDIVISSYALLYRDEKHLSEVEWGNVILDEAQNIKNPSTKQAQAARQLAGQAQWRAALTGTPVENRLAELWSIFQFLNPGYLGSQKDFQERFARPIERAGDEAATKRLKSLVGPFILRRVKTDPNVISDLPQKNEMKVYCSLTKEQATLYEAVVRDSLRQIAESEGIERRGIVLATLMKLKQVCNHPAQFMGDGSALPGRSGKLARLSEMLEEVRSVRERVLVFTQFAEMGGMLKAYLQERFGDEALFLYGGTPAKTRDKMVERFQNDPNGPMVFILSIKAGGTGLNLTRANHVFHFDRWWNPAVENQATDRAFRIGQTKNVQVYKYLCAGTFEEKIDDMIERKKALAASIVGTSEAWITELSTAQLRDLFALRKDAVGDE